MSDNEENNEKPFAIERAKQGRAACKKCKQKCLSGELRIAKLVSNPFGSGKLKQWYHLPCLFELFLTQRAATKRLEDPEELEGFDNLNEEDRDDILSRIEESEKQLAEKFGTKYSPKKPSDKKPNDALNKSNDQATSSNTSISTDKNHKDNLFREFRRLVASVTNENSYLEKSAIIKNMFTKGSDGSGFKGDLILWCRLLLPLVVKRIYNLQSKQLIKLFSVIFGTDRDDMLEHLEQGDVGETIQHFFENSKKVQPSKKSNLTVQEVDSFLEKLSTLTKEDEQTFHFRQFVRKCTSNDLKIIIRLIKHDLRMNAGAKPVLDAIHPDAYEAFQSSRDLQSVLKRAMKTIQSFNTENKVKATVTVMTPVLPMLAEACKSVDQAMKKCPNGMYSEIKYDGERVQVHKHGSEFKYFSRSLKPVMPHKVNHFKEYIPKAFPHAKDLILDSEVLLVDVTNGKPLPFGSLGVHKKEAFKDANVCLFVFDCIYYNGEVLTQKPMKERRRILRENMTEIPNRIMFSEMEEVYKADDLAAMITKVLKLGLEGLVLKDLMSIYEPGKRHWLKVKKDYLCDGAMADSADLIVLGAWFGTGKKGGMMSIFLMGSYDIYSKKFCTVTKVHTGHDDTTLERLQTELDMIKISSEPSKVPSWLNCTRTMVPDFVARDPKKQPVWEITGAEFTQQHDVHTADGISIRFPRVTRIRSDKTWESATNVQELAKLYRNSKENMDFSLLTVKNDPDEEASKCVQTKMDSFGIKIKTEANDEVVSSTSKRKNDFKSKSLKKIKKSYSLDESSEDKKSVKFTPMKINNHDFSKEPENKLIKREMYPIIFKDIKVLPMEGVKEENDNLLRYFIAVGGDLLEPESWEYATHVVHMKDHLSEIPKELPLTARHVTTDWIKDSIGNCQVQDTRPYAVQWIPT